MELWPYKLLFPQDVQADVRQYTLSGGRPILGDASAQFAAIPAECWHISYVGVNVYKPNLIRLFRSIASRRQGRLNPILVVLDEVDRRPYPLGYTGPAPADPFDDTTLFSDGTGWYAPMITAIIEGDFPQRATTVVIDMEPGCVLEPGHRFSVKHRAYEITRILDTAAGDVFTVRITPPLREAIHDDDTANFDFPVVRCRLATDTEMLLPLEHSHFGFPTVSFIEDPSTEPIIE